MVRNAIDHGIESAEGRRAAGKSEQGEIRISAAHRAGRIVIDVQDDGGGINRPRVREIAIKRGVIEPDAALTDEEIDNLIFAPGFSTAEVVSDLSGRGVGMDVVRRSVESMGGRLSVTSTPGAGTLFSLSLPLTLAVLDGMVVTVGAQSLVAPLTTLLESVKPTPDAVRKLGPNVELLAVRGALVPLIDLGASLGYGASPLPVTERIALIVEDDRGERAALLVDDILGQRQVVIKSLEANYHRVPGVAAATILGDGRVALILDVNSIVARHGAMRSEAA
jgi:two-component system chemotaxis sensor kinase CheA